MNAPLPDHVLPRVELRPMPAAMLASLRSRFGDRCSTAAAVREQHGRGESVYDAAPPEAVFIDCSTIEVAVAREVARSTR